MGAAGELQYLVPVSVAPAKVAWLEGRYEDVVRETEAAFRLTTDLRAGWLLGDLAVWRSRSGIDDEVSVPMPARYEVELAGDWARAARLWTDLGCPYDAALALSGADDDEPVRHSLAELQKLGARAAVAIVARRLRERGARGLPRGLRRSTRQTRLTSPHVSSRHTDSSYFVGMNDASHGGPWMRGPGRTPSIKVELNCTRSARSERLFAELLTARPTVRVRGPEPASRA
jgi:hypothetical protein